ncbi:MAG: hypothetical protein NTW68_01960 [candidate division NC10 bacterium]|nr:hypothetical protein [candidate division NC10 bacterium]
MNVTRAAAPRRFVLDHEDSRLEGRFRIEHTTIQIECERCAQGVLACVNGA